MIETSTKNLYLLALEQDKEKENEEEDKHDKIKWSQNPPQYIKFMSKSNSVLIIFKKLIFATWISFPVLVRVS